MNYNDRTFIKTILCIFAFIYFGLVDAAKRGFKWLAELLFAVALLFSLPARADAPLIWGSSGPQLIQSGALTAKDGSVYPKYYEKNYLAAGASSVGAAASPVWNASGAGITCTTTTSNLPDASVGTALAVTGQSGAAGTEFCFYNYDIDQADGSKVLKLVEDQLPISGYVASDFRLDVYSCTVAWSGTPATTCSGTSTRLTLSTDNSSGVTALPALTGTLTPPPTYSTPAYASAPHLQARIGLNGASTHQMNFAQVLTGPGTVVQSAAVGPWQSYTPIVGGVTIGNGTITAYWRQVGDTVEVDDSVVKGSTTTTSSSDLAFSLPNSWTINSSAVSAATRGQAVSGVGHYRGASTSDFSAIAVYISSTGVGLAGPVATANAGSSIWSGNSPLTNTNDEIAIHFVVPVNELAGQGTVFLATTPTSGTASVKCDTGNGYGSTNTKIRRFTNCTTSGTAITYADSATLGGAFTVNEAGVYSVSYTDYNSGATAIIGVSRNTTSPTASIETLTTAEKLMMASAPTSDYAQVSVSFVASAGDIIRAHTDGGANGTLNRVQFSIAKLVNNPGQATGFAAASATAPGLVSYEDSGSFTWALTGPASTNLTGTYYKLGKVATINWSSNAGNGCSSAAIFVGSSVIPTSLRPAIGSNVAVAVRNSSSDQAALGQFTVGSTGNVTIAKDASGATFTGSGTCGWYSGSMSYLTN